MSGREPLGEAMGELRNAVHELGREIAKAMRLHEIVDWLNQRLTR